LLGIAILRMSHWRWYIYLCLASKK